MHLWSICKHVGLPMSAWDLRAWYPKVPATEVNGPCREHAVLARNEPDRNGPVGCEICIQHHMVGFDTMMHDALVTRALCK